MNPPLSESPRLAEWAASLHTEQPAEPPKAAELIPLADSPRVIHQAFAAQGWEVETYWQPFAPETAPEASRDDGTIDPNNVPPCPRCGSYALWENMAGTWRCVKCDPPHKSNLLQRKAVRFRRLSDSTP